VSLSTKVQDSSATRSKAVEASVVTGNLEDLRAAPSGCDASERKIAMLDEKVEEQNIVLQNLHKRMDDLFDALAVKEPASLQCES